MELTIVPGRDLLQISGARIRFKNFSGAGSIYNNEGERNFSLIIPDEEMAEILRENKNDLGAGWNVKIKVPENGDPYIHMKVNVKYTERSQPNVYLVSGSNMVKLNEQTIGMLDDIRIEKVDLDIRPYDGESRFGPFRAAYLQSMKVYQDLTGDRFASEYEDYKRRDNDGYDEY